MLTLHPFCPCNCFFVSFCWHYCFIYFVNFFSIKSHPILGSENSVAAQYCFDMVLPSELSVLIATRCQLPCRINYPRMLLELTSGGAGKETCCSKTDFILATHDFLSRLWRAYLEDKKWRFTSILRVFFWRFFHLFFRLMGRWRQGCVFSDHL